MVRRALCAAGVLLALSSSARAGSPAGAQTSPRAAGGAHTLIVRVEQTMTPAAEKRLAVLVLVSRNDAAPAGALATPRKPVTVLQQSGGLYRVKAEIDSACKGSCDAPSVRLSGSANHVLEVVPRCRPAGSGFVCTKVRIVQVY